MPMAALNITSAVIPTTALAIGELGCPCMRTRSDAAIRMPTSRNGARTPLITAVQYSADTGFTLAKSSPTPMATEKMNAA